MLIRATIATQAKPSTEQSTTLDPSQLVAFQVGKTTEIESWELTQNHIKVTLVKPLKKATEWFFYAPHIEVADTLDGEEDVLYPIEEQATHAEITFRQNSMIKLSIAQGATLGTGQKLVKRLGETIEAADYEAADGNHIRFIVADPTKYPNGQPIWYAYLPHLKIVSGETQIFPLPTPPRLIPEKHHNLGATIKLPSGKKVYLNESIIKGGNFLWREATHGGDRIPQALAHEQNIIALATQLQKAREQIGKVFRVTSWYRPDPWNRRAGGARRSQHLEGKGIDIVVDGYSGRELGRLLMPWWPGGLGIYPGDRTHILHLDIGTKRNWGF